MKEQKNKDLYARSKLYIHSNKDKTTYSDIVFFEKENNEELADFLKKIQLKRKEKLQKSINSF